MKTIQTLILHAPYAGPDKPYAKEAKAFITSEASPFLIVPKETKGIYALYLRRCGANASSLLPSRRKLNLADIARFIDETERLVDLTIFEELPAITAESETFPTPETERGKERLRKIRTDVIELVWPIVAPVGA